MESCFRLFRVDCEGVFTTEAQSSQSSEYFFNKKSLLRVLRASAVQSPSPALRGSLKNLLLKPHTPFRGWTA
jgi:hypothetical protein